MKTWSPLVWLAPNEKFLPGDVRTFLSNVHAEREKQGNKKIKDIGDNLSKYSHYYQNDVFEDLIYYEGVDKPAVVGASTVQNNRKRRNFDKDTSLEYIFELPIDDASENWYLVTNDELGKDGSSSVHVTHDVYFIILIAFVSSFRADNLMKNKSSFIFGERPSFVPIYALVNMCESNKDSSPKQVNEIEASTKFHYKKNPYIPLTKTPEIYDYSSVTSNKVKDELKFIENNKLETNVVDRHQEDDDVKANRRKRSEDSLNQTQPVNLTEQSNERWKIPSVIIYTKDDKVVLPSVPQSIIVDEIKIVHDIPAASSPSNIPHFHVTYWMFYPFSQGKTVCTLNLGPLGPIPIPLLPIFNICLGTKKEFGSHVGDWEHMSLFFRGRMEPDVSSYNLKFSEASLKFILCRKCMFQLMMLEQSIVLIDLLELSSSRVKRREREFSKSQRFLKQS